MQNSPFDWARTRAALKSRLGSEAISRWMDPLKVASVSSQSVVLEAPNTFFRDWVNAHYLDALKAHAGGREISVTVSIAGSVSTGHESAVKPIGQSAASASALGEVRRRAGGQKNTDAGDGLNQRFTFDRFVVGQSNRFAHAASLAVVESPARAYNPLFIYGGVGLGKTHLMHAIGHAVLRRWPNRRVVYLSSERFTNELISAIQTKTTAKFRNRYRTVDVLLVDDIQFIARKEATQEEFFHTFNVLYDSHKQIVISSDRSPNDIPGLEERLISRFEWGLVTDIHVPDLETRIAILRKKASESNIDVSDGVVTFIAGQITSNIRELEGALIRVIAYCNFFNKPQTAFVAQEVLRDMVKEVSSRVTLEFIQQRVAEFFQIDRDELRGAKRQRSVLYPRQLAMYLCRKLTESSLPEIGQAFGGRDHTTVLHAVDKITKEIAQDDHKKRLVEQLNEVVASSSNMGR